MDSDKNYKIYIKNIEFNVSEEEYIKHHKEKEHSKYLRKEERKVTVLSYDEVKDIMVQNHTLDEYKSMNTHKEIAYASIYDTLNYENNEEYYINGKNTSIYGAEPTIAKMIQGFERGIYPRNKDEAVISINAKDIFDLNKGDKVTLNTPDGNVDFIICGFCDNSEIFYLEDTIGLFVNKDAFENLCAANGKETHFADYIQFKNEFNIKKIISDFKRDFNLTENDMGENTALLGIMGMSTNSSMTGIYVVAGILTLLILLAGVFMISGSINTAVAKRTQFFGMLRCIGASKRQVINIVRLEAFSWCKTAVPIGVFIGVLLSFILCAIVRFGVGGEFSDMPVFQISMIGIVFGALIGLITVFIATSSPARRAAKTSPVIAVMGNAVTYKASTIFSKGSLKIENRLGISYAFGAKKNLILMSGSFALSIVLFLCFNTVLDCVKSALPAMRPSTPDFCVMLNDRSNSIDNALLYKLSNDQAVESAFGRMFSSAVPIETQKSVHKIDLISYAEIQLNWAKEDISSGDIESVIRGDGVLTALDLRNPLTLNDEITMFGEKTKISGVLATVPFDNTDGTPIVICSEDMFKRLTKAEGYAVIDVRLNKNADGTDIARLRGITGEGYNISDRLQTNRDTVKTYIAFALFVYGFLVLIALISLFNIINSISMSVSAKMKQYGILRAIGTECTQIKKMIRAEATVYALCGTISGFLIGIPLHKFFYEILITGHFGDEWKFPVTQVLIICLFMILSVVLSIYTPGKKIAKMSTAEILSEGIR